MVKSPLGQIRKLAGQFVFNRLIFPTEGLTHALVPFPGDYGHGYLYEELFSGDGSDLSFASKWCQAHPGTVLDLAGGAGRLALRLCEEKNSVYLVDRSTTMLAQLRKKWATLSPENREKLRICPVDMESMELDTHFQTVYSLNNALEHPDSELGILATLRNVHRHLEPNGHFFIDVHNLEHLESEWHFRLGIWRYTQDQMIGGKRYRVWSRTYPGVKDSQTVCEHAVSSNLNQFLLLKTTIHFLAKEHWSKLFEVAGFKVDRIWGNWDRAPVTPALPKLVFCLRRRDASS